MSSRVPPSTTAPLGVSEESRVTRESTGYQSIRRKVEGMEKGESLSPEPHLSVVPEICLVSVVWFRARWTFVPPASSGPAQKDWSRTHTSPRCGGAICYLGFSLSPHPLSGLSAPLSAMALGYDLKITPTGLGQRLNRESTSLESLRTRV